MIKGRIRSALAGIIAGAMFLTAIPSIPENSIEASAASLCTVNTSKTYQTIRGFGGMNHPEWQSYKGGGDMKASEVQTAFGNGDNELGLTILRIFVSDDQNAWKNAIPTAQRAQALGATVFATPWNPPASMRHAGGGGDQSGMYVLNDGSEAAYAKHLNSFVKYCESQNVTLNSISVQNEPDFSKEWTYWSPERTTNFIANYGRDVVAGTKAKLMSPESFQYGAWSTTSRNYYNNILNNAKAMANCDIFGTHFYGTPRNKMDFPALENSGKEIWMTEVYVPNSDADSANRYPEAIDVAENIHNALVVGNMSAYVWWYIRRSYSLLTEDGKPSKRGYMMAHFSKWVRPGAVRIDATEQPANNVFVSAYKNTDGTVAIVAINKGSEGYAQQFSVNGTITDVDRYRTTSGENLALTSNLEHDTNTFWAQLPAESVTTFVVSLSGRSSVTTTSSTTTTTTTTTTKAIEPDSNGYYLHDTFEGSVSEWTGRGSATVELSGRRPFADKEALLVSGRNSAWNGAQMSLDSNTFKPGSTYSFSVDATFLDGKSRTNTMMLSLQYKDSDGEVKYGHIAQASAIRGRYVQLANSSYTIPSGASDLVLYVETESGSDNFYIDEAIIAVKDTKIDGPAELKLNSGDVNFNGRIDVFDAILARRGLVSGFSDGAAEIAADVDEDGKFSVADFVQISNYVLGRSSEFSVYTPPEPEPSDFIYESALAYHEAPDYLKPCSQKGTITKEYYSGINGNKALNVYTPYGYDSSKKYNVFYLMHGGGENENTVFSDSVKMNNILDHMIMNGELEPMIVVTPTFNGCPTSDGNMGAGTVWDEMRQSIIPFVEGKYSTYADSTSMDDLKASRFHRAYGGFSMGGGSTWNMLINNLDICAYYMPLSGHCWGGATGIQNAIDRSGLTQRDYFVLAATGDKDIAYGNMQNLIPTLKSDTKRFTYTSDFSQGNFYFLVANSNDGVEKTHWWGFVRWYIYDALPYFFHEGR